MSANQNQLNSDSHLVVEVWFIRQLALNIKVCELKSIVSVRFCIFFPPLTFNYLNMSVNMTCAKTTYHWTT